MAEVEKKSASWAVPQEEYEAGHNHAAGASLPELYDPSKESIWTRLGLTAESFKRAPGTTGYVHPHPHIVPHIVDVSPPVRPSLLYLTRILQWSSYLGRGRDRIGPDEASGQPDVAAEDEAAPLGTS